MRDNVIYLRSYAYLAQIDVMLNRVESEYLSKSIDWIAAKRTLYDLSELLSRYPELRTASVMSRICDISGRFAARCDI